MINRQLTVIDRRGAGRQFRYQDFVYPTCRRRDTGHIGIIGGLAGLVFDRLKQFSDSSLGVQFVYRNHYGDLRRGVLAIGLTPFVLGAIADAFSFQAGLALVRLLTLCACLPLGKLRTIQ